MAWKTLDDMELAGKRVLIRVDYNVPLRDGRVSDPTRISRGRVTVADVIEKGGRPVLLSHFDRPKGRVVPEMSLGRLVGDVERELGYPVLFAALEEAEEASRKLPEGYVLLVENTRFHPGDEANDPDFAARLALLGDVFVNDAFSSAHRAHASTEGVARLLPACAGRLMEAELRALEAALTTPERPVVALVGGAKVSTKLALLRNLIDKVETLVIGGGMANTFLAARGVPVGRSLAEHDLAPVAREVMGKAVAAGCRILLPEDVVVAREFRAHAPHEVVPASACPADAMILDAGPASVERIGEAFRKARTLVWNGPLGAFEIAPFDAATKAAAQMAAQLTREGRLCSVAGGGDTVAALNQAGAAEDFSYVSTAGGAFLEWLEGRTLPGVAALER